MTNQEQYELICEKAKKYDRLVEVLDKIRAEIKAEKIKEKRYDNDNHIFIHKDICIGLQEALDIIDKYKDEQEEVDDWRDRLDELEREEYYESKYGKEQE